MAGIVHELRSLELGESQQPVYDRPIGIRELFVDPQSGAEHYLVRYPAGMTARRHRHGVAHTIIVLDGAMEVDGRTLRPGGYVHHPANTVMHHAPAEGEDCLFVIMFDGPFDVTVED